MSMVRTQETAYRARLGFEAAIDVHFLRQRREVIDYTVVLLARERGQLERYAFTTTLTEITTCTDTIEKVSSSLPRSFIEAPRVRLCRARSKRSEAATER